MDEKLNIDYVNLVYERLPNKVKTLVTENIDGGYTIIVNSNLTYENVLEAVKHEMWHIVKDDFSNNDVNAIEQNAHAV